MSENVTLTLRGRIATDLRTYTTSQGTLSARFRLAVPQWRITDAGTFEERDPHWYTVRIWDRLASHAVASIRKGTPVIVVGKPTTRAWSDENGQPRAELVVNAQSVGIDLAYGVAQILRPVTSTESGSVQTSDHASPGEFQVHPSAGGENPESGRGTALIVTPEKTHDEAEGSLSASYRSAGTSTFTPPRETANEGATPEGFSEGEESPLVELPA